MPAHSQFLQACNEQGEPLSSRGLTHDEVGAGALHLAAHVWMWRKNHKAIEVLVQKRAADKRTWPGFFDISAAGHVDFRETPLTAAMRETREELGLNLKKEDLRLLFVHRQYMKDDFSGRIENEVQYVYGVTLESEETITFADGEVELVDWLQLEDFIALTRNEEKTNNTSIVPHGEAYFTELLKEINRLSQ